MKGAGCFCGEELLDPLPGKEFDHFCIKFFQHDAFTNRKKKQDKGEVNQYNLLLFDSVNLFFKNNFLGMEPV